MSFDPTKKVNILISVYEFFCFSIEFSNEMLWHILLTFKISTNVNPVHAKMELHVSMVSLLTLVYALKDTLMLIVEQVCYHIFQIAKIISLNRNWLFYKNYIFINILGVDIDNCHPNPCNNGGTCTDGVDSFTCDCADGWTGETCNESKNNFYKNWLLPNMQVSK